MIRRGYNTVYEACRTHKLIGYGGKRRSAPGGYHSERTVARVTERVLMGERIDDAWRKELDSISYRDFQQAQKETPA